MLTLPIFKIREFFKEGRIHIKVGLSSPAKRSPMMMRSCMGMCTEWWNALQCVERRDQLLSSARLPSHSRDRWKRRHRKRRDTRFQHVAHPPSKKCKNDPEDKRVIQECAII
ncbi:hypothetical protein TNCV_3536841 [Trichonephila clavipes]|uniref:Uncharacterized protein n=1 Tax=Trichonephila clavipes TaxID=2585209 RepID=A0A8X6VWW7_TRICX|nr:hypothetical protein TNCV_3536841 [Trichonephila clavipes]